MTFGSGMKFGRFRDGREKKTSPKTLFRQSKVWKDFRAAMIDMNKNKCELCPMVYTGKRIHMLQCHHLRPEDYYNLDPADFSILCPSDHDLVERWVTMINGANFTPPDNFSLWMAVLLPHISQPARQKVEDILAGNYQMPEKTKKAKAPKRKQE